MTAPEGVIFLTGDVSMDCAKREKIYGIDGSVHREAGAPPCFQFSPLPEAMMTRIVKLWG